MIHVWEFEYYSKDFEEETTCYYYSYSDNRTVPIRQFVEDEGPIDFTCVLDEVITEEEMERNHNGLELVLDKDEE